MAEPKYNEDTNNFLAVQKKMGGDKQGDYFGLEQWELMSPAAKAFMIKTLLGIVENMPPPTPTATTGIQTQKKPPIKRVSTAADDLDSVWDINRPDTF